MDKLITRFVRFIGPKHGADSEFIFRCSILPAFHCAVKVAQKKLIRSDRTCAQNLKNSHNLAWTRNLTNEDNWGWLISNWRLSTMTSCHGRLPSIREQPWCRRANSTAEMFLESTDNDDDIAGLQTNLNVRHGLFRGQRSPLRCSSFDGESRGLLWRRHSAKWTHSSNMDAQARRGRKFHPTLNMRKTNMRQVIVTSQNDIDDYW